MGGVEALVKELHTDSGIKSAKGRNRTDDTSIFSAVLYQLSYLGMATCAWSLLLPYTRYNIA